MVRGALGVVLDQVRREPLHGIGRPFLHERAHAVEQHGHDGRIQIRPNGQGLDVHGVLDVVVGLQGLGMTELIIKAVGLKKSFELGGFMSNRQKVIALDGVDVTVEAGQAVAIIGESGSGKTTLGKALCRLLRLDDGSIEFLGQDLLMLSGKPLLNVRKGFQMVFQNQSANLHPRMSVEEMLSESLKLHRSELSEGERQTHINELAEQVGLSERLNQRPTSLSGGEKRRAGSAG